jgi:hypothetical protein
VTVRTDAPQADGPDCRRSLRGPVGDFSHGKEAGYKPRANPRDIVGPRDETGRRKADAGNPHVRFDERGRET